MKALVYHGPGQRSWDTVPDPGIVDPTDAVVRIDTSTICGSDLHILKGDVPETAPGTVLGHEAVGTVEAVGAGVTTVAPGDRVLVSCISACGRCRFCKEAHYGQCLGGGGWILGHTVDGLQAEYARTPFADTSLYKLPDAMSDEQVLFLADILPTSYEVGVLNGAVGPGDVLAIVGAGPIGLSAVLTAGLLSPSRIVVIDLDDGRLARAREFGADVTINNGTEDASPGRAGGRVVRRRRRPHGYAEDPRGLCDLPRGWGLIRLSAGLEGRSEPGSTGGAAAQGRGDGRPGRGHLVVPPRRFVSVLCRTVPMMMRAEGLEPPSSCEHRDLNPARLPVPPRPRAVTIATSHAARL
jgi:NADPH:quinone reductase-like Zn-dependent oxidoreductase